MHSNRVLVRPAKKGLKVPDENGKFIPYKEGGHSVPTTAFYNRLIGDGDLVKINVPVNDTPVDETKRGR